MHALPQAYRVFFGAENRSYARAQNLWLPTTHYDKIYSAQYLPYRVKYVWWLVIPTTVVFYWMIVLKVSHDFEPE